jgi:uncharacterized protein
MVFDWSSLGWVAFAFTAAGFVKGVVGLGLPTVAIGLLSVMMAPAAAAALLIAPSLATNLWQMIDGPGLLALARRLATLLAALVVGTFITISVLTGLNAGLASAALGAVLIVYGGIGLAGVRWQVPVRVQPIVSPLVGLATGLVTGATGVFVFPLVPYLNSLGLNRDELIQALGLSFTVATLGLAAALGSAGGLSTISGLESLVAMGGAVAGMAIGQKVRGRIAAETFKRWFFAGLVALGLYMLGRGFLRA